MTNNRNFSARNFNNSEIPASQIIARKGRLVGSEDMEAAAKKLQWVENETNEHGAHLFRGKTLDVAAQLSRALLEAVNLSFADKHEEAAKKAGNCLYVLGKDKQNAIKFNRRYLGGLSIDCRDGQRRKLGDMLEWYMSTHFRIAEQIAAATEYEKAEAEAAEMEMVQFAESILEGQEESKKSQKAA
jgi:hypothetical protein